MITDNTRMAYIAREPGQPGASGYINAEQTLLSGTTARATRHVAQTGRLNMTDSTQGDDMETPPPTARVEIKVQTDIDPDKVCINCGQPRECVGCSTCPHCGTPMCE